MSDATEASRRILVTTALPYANGSLHLGHMVEYVQADVFVRFLRMSGKKVTFVCADDQHGAPIELAAMKAGITPQELIAKYKEEHESDFNDFLISFDTYHGTHSDENKHYSELIFNKLKEKDLIYQRQITQLFDEKAKRYLPDRFVKGTCPKCKAPDQYGDQCEVCNSVYKPTDLIKPYSVISKAAPVERTSTHFFFKLSAVQKQVHDWVSSNELIQPEIKNFVNSWVEKGLEDWDITRDGPYFGFKIPETLNQYFYVWLDAPIGYISASEVFAKENLQKDASVFWKGDNADIYHFIGKDIIYFHLIFWPAMLMNSGFNTPKDIAVHGHLTINGEKMSKSRGNFYTAREYLDEFDPELLRFYYTANLSRNVADLNLDFKDFHNKINNELIANIANFIYRTLSFCNNKLDSKLGKIADKDKDLLAQVQKKADDVLKHYEERNFRDAVKKILQIGSLGNKFFQDSAPWVLIKEDEKRCREVITASANIAQTLTLLLTPILPNFAVKMQKQLKIDSLTFDRLDKKLENHDVDKARIVFSTLEEIPSLGEELFPADLRVAKIDFVKEHPNADKLYVLQISIGDEKRQLVAGLREHYTPEELKDKKIVVVSNLQHAMIRGEKSQGMLCAAENKDGSLALVAAPKSVSGDGIYPEGMKVSSELITIDDFYGLKLSVEDKRVFYQDKMLRTEKEEVVATAENGAKIR